MTDKEIIDLYREGHEEKAFRTIVDSYSERLYWHVRNLVISHDDADDLMQEIFIKIWQSLSSFRGDSGLFTWVYRIATNESLNFLRKRKVRAALSFRSMEPDLERKIEDDPCFNGGEAQKILLKAVARLPEKQRLVFSMRYWQDLKYEEISEILDVSVGSLKASYHIACEKIKAELKEHF